MFLDNFPKRTADLLIAAGVETAEQAAALGVDDLSKIKGIGDKTAVMIYNAAMKSLPATPEPEPAAPEPVDPELPEWVLVKLSTGRKHAIVSGHWMSTGHTRRLSRIAYLATERLAPGGLEIIG